MLTSGRDFACYGCVIFQVTLYQTKIKHCACKSPHGVVKIVEAHVIDNNGKSATCNTNVLVTGKICLFTYRSVCSFAQTDSISYMTRCGYFAWCYIERDNFVLMYWYFLYNTVDLLNPLSVH